VIVIVFDLLIEELIDSEQLSTTVIMLGI